MNKLLYYQRRDVALDYEAKRVESAAGALLQAWELDALRQALPTQGPLVELACGTGRLMRVFKAEGREVIGVDQSRAMAEAGGWIPDQDVLIANIQERIPLPDAQANGVYALRFTNHLADWNSFLKEGARILKPHGRFVFDSMRWSPLFWDSPRWGGRNFTIRDTALRGLIEAHGLRVLRVRALFPIGPYMLAHLPLSLVRGLLRAQRGWPDSACAIALWETERV